MRYLRIFAVLGICLVSASFAHAQRVVVGVGFGAPAYVGPAPVCDYGYFDYYPYACAPYGYYGPEWFNGGFFIGAGPWFHGFYGRPGFRGRDWDDRGWREFNEHHRDFDNRGGRNFDHARSFNGGERFRGEGGFQGGRESHGNRGSNGGGGFHGGGGSHGGGAGSFHGDSSHGGVGRGSHGGGSSHGGGHR
jgi:uncharacterized membrane protein YgcG